MLNEFENLLDPASPEYSFPISARRKICGAWRKVRANRGAGGIDAVSYTLLYNRIATHLNMIGLDPYLGFFHQARNGHAALASDLVEEFRPVVADALVLKLIRRKQLQPSDFARTGGKFHLTETGKRTFFTEFEAKLGSKRQTPSEGNNNLSFAKIIERQAYQLSRVITGQDKQYQPFNLK